MLRYPLSTNYLPKMADSVSANVVGKIELRVVPKSSLDDVRDVCARWCASLVDCLSELRRSDLIMGPRRRACLRRGPFAAM